MLTALLLACALLCPCAHAAPSTAYVDRAYVWDLPDVVFHDHVTDGFAFDLVYPTTVDLVPPTPITGDEDPHAAACVAGERPAIVRHFQRGSRGYVATC